MSQLELLDAQRSELRNRRAALQVRVGAVPGDRGPGARAGWRLGEHDMNDDPNKDLGGPIMGIVFAALALLLMLLA